MGNLDLIGIKNKDGHLTEAAFEAMRRGELCKEAESAVIEHLARCECCAAIYAGGFDVIEEVPAGFAEEVEKKAGSRKGSRRDFAVYTFRVALAACVALLITFSSSFNAVATQQKTVNIKAPGFSVVDKISTQLRDLSQNILNWRV